MCLVSLSDLRAVLCVEREDLLDRRRVEEGATDSVCVYVCVCVRERERERERENKI